MGERKQADMFGPPLGETLHRSLEEPLRHTAIPEVWPDGQGTEVRVMLQYDPPAGLVGVAMAKILGEEPAEQIEEDLRRFKQVMETGEISTAANSRLDASSR